MSLEIPKVASLSRERADNRSLLEYANQNRDEGFFDDVNIQVANECFPANRMVLSCFSRVFERMFKVEMKERYEQTVEVKQVDEKSMKIVIDYIYTGHIDIDNENVMDLLAAADYLELEEVKKFCFEFLISILSLDTWYAIFTASQLYENESFKRHFRQYLSKNVDEICQTEIFKSLSKGVLTSFIQNLNRNRVEEASVYQAILIWTKFDEVERKMEFPDLIQCIQFHKLSGKFFNEFVSTESLIIGNSKCMQLIMKAFSKLLTHKNVIHSKIISCEGMFTQQTCFQAFDLFEENFIDFPDLPIPLYDLKVLLVNNVAYCIGGISNKTVSKKVWKMNVKNGDSQWLEIASLPLPRYCFGAAVFHDSIVIAGGCSAADQPSLPYCSSAMYHIALNQWRPLPKMKQGLLLDW